MTTADLVSGAGVILMITAFLLTTIDWMSAESRTYFLLNLVGGGLAAVGAWLVGSVPFLVMEVVWTLVAAVGLIRTYRA